MPKKIIFNADDFGISQGVNQAIEQAHKEGVLNSTSIMITLKWAEQAVAMAKNMPELNIGLHGNLTNQRAVLSHREIPLLTDEQGNFKNGFVSLALLNLLHPKELKRQAKAEIEAQIKLALNSGIKLTHIDSHRHIHMIPAIFQAFLELKQQYNIPRMRFINENPLRTIAQTSSKQWFQDGAWLKSIILSACAIIDKLFFGYKSDTYFYSIINTCKISRDKLHKIKVPAKYSFVEVMLHPGIPEIDKQYMADVFDDNILKDWRAKELATLLDKSIKDEFI